MKYASVCSGVEAASLAWMPLGWKAAWFSEIEPFPCAVLKERFPNVPNLGDMTKIKVENLENGDQKFTSGDGAVVIVPGGVDLLVGGTPCFPAGTMVLTPGGYKPIDTLKIGDEVVSHNGNVCKVSAVGSKIAPIGKLKIGGRPEIPCTDNHPFLTIDVKRDNRRKSATYSQIIPCGDWDFTQAKDSAAKYAGRIQIKPILYSLPETPLQAIDLLELAGWYVGDGYIRRFEGKNKKAIILALVSSQKIETFKDHFEGKINFSIGADGKVTIYNTLIAEFLIENFGVKAEGKKVPYWLYSAEDLKAAFLLGLEATDGCNKGYGCSITTVSEALAYGIADLYRNASVRRQKVEQQKEIEGRLINQRDYYVVSAYKNRTPKTKFINGRYASRIKEFKDGNGAVGTVFNITVSGDHTYIVNGIAVHNCQSFSVAGKREGLDGASGLARTFVQLLESMQPRWFVWENVPGCLSSRNKQTGIYDFNFLLAAFAEVGYTCGWRILDAQYVRVDGYPRAIPQRRRRVFVVGHLGAEWQYPCEVLFEPHSLSGNTPPRRVKGQGTATDAQRCLGTASTLRMRAGCEGGGKGALISNERSLTLAAAGNDQTGFTGRPWDNSGVNPTLSQCGAANGTPGSSDQELFAQNFNGLVADVDATTFWNGNQYAESLTCTSDRQLMPDKARLQCVITPSGSEIADTLDASYYKGVGSRDGKERTVVLLNDQGGSVMNVEKDGNAGTLRANTHGNEQIVCQGEVISCNSKKQGMDISNELCGTLNATDYKEPQVVCYENHANDSRVKNMGECCQTLEARAGMGGGNLPLVQECYSVDRRNQTVDAELSGTLTNCGGGDNYNTVMESIAFEPGIAKREGGHSRFAEGVSSTLRRDMGDNQTAVAIAENIIGRQVQNGGNGTGAQEELAYTQNASGVMGVAQGVDVYNHTETGDIATTITANSGEPNTAGPKVMTSATVRRLLPIECERLMGFPDNWTRIPWKGKPAEDCPDSPRYKACGNSMCINVMRWLGLRIELVERRTQK